MSHEAMPSEQCSQLTQGLINTATLQLDSGSTSIVLCKVLPPRPDGYVRKTEEKWWVAKMHRHMPEKGPDPRKRGVQGEDPGARMSETEINGGELLHGRDSKYKGMVREPMLWVWSDKLAMYTSG